MSAAEFFGKSIKEDIREDDEQEEDDDDEQDSDDDDDDDDGREGDREVHKRAALKHSTQKLEKVNAKNVSFGDDVAKLEAEKKKKKKLKEQQRKEEEENNKPMSLFKQRMLAKQQGLN